jgi:hypothetical protein
MKLSSTIILFFNKYLISTQEYFILLFTCLAIFVTLIAISSSLTREVRQDLFKKYYLTSLLIRLYLAWLAISFLISIVVCYSLSIYLNLINPCLLIITFFWTVVFIWLFLLRLNRNWLYEKLFKEFKKEVILERRRGKARKAKGVLNYSRFQYKSLDSLFENILHVQNNSQDFIKEIDCLKGFIKYSLDNEREDIIQDFFNLKIININNISFYEALINMLHDLMLKKHDDLKKILHYQQFLYRITVQYFYKIE